MERESNNNTFDSSNSAMFSSTAAKTDQPESERQALSEPQQQVMSGPQLSTATTMSTGSTAQQVQRHRLRLFSFFEPRRLLQLATQFHDQAQVLFHLASLCQRARQFLFQPLVRPHFPSRLLGRQAHIIDINIMLEPPALSARYFCHSCNIEVRIGIYAQYACPRCNGGFVRALNRQTGSGPCLVANRISQMFNQSARIDSGSSSAMRIIPIVGEMPFAGVYASFHRFVTAVRMQDINALAEYMNTIVVGGVGGDSLQRPHANNFDRTLMSLLQMLSSNRTSTTIFLPRTMGHMGNQGWGEDRIDSIVSQMLHNQSAVGAPPLNSERIADIPNVAVTAEDVADELQCAVCLETFDQHEAVKRLCCKHLFHDECIVPWLTLHSTCPVCRSSLADEGNQDAENEDQQEDDNSMYQPS